MASDEEFPQLPIELLIMIFRRAWLSERLEAGTVIANAIGPRWRASNDLLAYRDVLMNDELLNPAVHFIPRNRLHMFEMFVMRRRRLTQARIQQRTGIRDSIYPS